MHHDFAATRNHVIFMDLPVVFDLEVAMQGGMPFGWSDTYGARLGVMPRAGTNADMRWYDIEPCYVFHTMNAFEDAAGRIVLDAGRHASMWKGGPDKFEPCFQYRWTLDPATGRVTEEAVDDISQAFPRMDDRRAACPTATAMYRSASRVAATSTVTQCCRNTTSPPAAASITTSGPVSSAASRCSWPRPTRRPRTTATS